MKSNEYRAMFDAVDAAQNIIQCISNPGYPRTDFPSAGLRDMFHELNDICIRLIELREAAEAAEGVNSNG